MALLTSDLKYVMKKDPTFAGVFALDKLPHVKKKNNIKLIINLDPSTKPGSHWVLFGAKVEILDIILIVLGLYHLL